MGYIEDQLKLYKKKQNPEKITPLSPVATEKTVNPFDDALQKYKTSVEAAPPPVTQPTFPKEAPPEVKENLLDRINNFSIHERTTIPTPFPSKQGSSTLSETARMGGNISVDAVNFITSLVTGPLDFAKKSVTETLNPNTYKKLGADFSNIAKNKEQIPSALVDIVKAIPPAEYETVKSFLGSSLPLLVEGVLSYATGQTSKGDMKLQELQKNLVEHPFTSVAAPLVMGAGVKQLTKPGVKPTPATPTEFPTSGPPIPSVTKPAVNKPLQGQQGNNPMALTRTNVQAHLNQNLIPEIKSYVDKGLTPLLKEGKMNPDLVKHAISDLGGLMEREMGVKGAEATLRQAVGAQNITSIDQLSSLLSSASDKLLKAHSTTLPVPKPPLAPTMDGSFTGALQTVTEIAERVPRLAERGKEFMASQAERAAKIQAAEPAVANAYKTNLDERYINTLTESDAPTLQAYKKIQQLADEVPKTLGMAKNPAVVAGETVVKQFEVIEKARKDIGAKIGEEAQKLSKTIEVDMTRTFDALEAILANNGIGSNKNGLTFRATKFTPEQQTGIQQLWDLARGGGNKLTPTQIHDLDSMFATLKREGVKKQLTDLMITKPDGTGVSLYSVFRDAFSMQLDSVSPRIRALNAKYAPLRNMVDNINSSLLKMPNFLDLRNVSPAEFAKVNLRRIFGEAQSSAGFEAVADAMDKMSRQLGYTGASPKTVAAFAEELRKLYPEIIPATGFVGSVRLGVGDIVSKILNTGIPNIVEQRAALRELIQHFINNQYPAVKKPYNSTRSTTTPIAVQTPEKTATKSSKIAKKGPISPEPSTVLPKGQAVGETAIPVTARITAKAKKNFPKGFTKIGEDFSKESVFLREAKGLSADQIMAKYPNIKLKKDVPVTDIYGAKRIIPDGEVLTPYEMKGNKVVLQDGETYIVSKNQYQNIKGNAVTGEAKPFAPELKGLEETVYSEKNLQTPKQFEGWTNNDIKSHYEDLFGEKPQRGQSIDDLKNAIAVEEDVAGVGDMPTATKYENYQLPNGKNYREVLIQAPLEMKPGEYGTDVIDTSKRFRSSHWDEPNVISHLRINDRTYNGKKVAFMEELQSDWAREARAGKTTASHPLLKNWQELSVKRALQDAVDSKAEYFSWINGEQTSARYNLAKQVENVKWNPSQIGGKTIQLVPRTGGDNIGITIDKVGQIIGSSDSTWKGKKLDEVLGKGLADKIMAQETGNLSGEGLKFGGEWADNLYNKQVKNIVEDLTGGKVEVIDLKLPIEGKGNRTFRALKPDIHILTPKEIKVGLEIRSGHGNELGEYIITDVLGNGKFKAVTKNFYDRAKRGAEVFIEKTDQSEALKRNLSQHEETFDISQKTTTQQAIKLTPEIKARIRGEAPKIEKSGKRF